MGGQNSINRITDMIGHVTFTETRQAVKFSLDLDNPYHLMYTYQEGVGGFLLNARATDCPFGLDIHSTEASADALRSCQSTQSPDTTPLLDFATD